ncbi:MAG: Crp/Fnr family transcriptional regulator [Elusimicrobia bacterium]|nr:Crp/Fnr family transcriptional regulator [Elusimicrobiota bacterium]
MERGENTFIDCAGCNHKGVCLYSKLTSERTRSKWNNHKKIHIKNNNDTIYTENEKPFLFHILCKGRAKIYKEAANGSKCVIIEIKKPGSMLGYAICKERTYNCNARSMGKSTVATFTRDLWVEIIREDFEFCKEILMILCNEITNLQKKLCNMAYKTAEEKVASILINHISFVNKKLMTPIVYNLKRSEIAELSGLRVETVVRTLQKFEKDNILKRNNNFIKIINPEMLFKIGNEKE